MPGLKPGPISGTTTTATALFLTRFLNRFLRTTRKVISWGLALCLLFGEFGFKGLLSFCDGVFVACGIDPDGCSFGGHTLEFFQHVEVHAMRSEEDVAGQAAQHVEGVDIVGGNTGVRRPLGLGVDQAVAGVDVPASDDNYVASDAVIFGNHGPGGATTSVAWGFVRSKHGAAKAHCFAIVQDA